MMDMNNPMFWLLLNNNNNNNDNLFMLMMLQQNPNFFNDPNNPFGSFLFADTILNDDEEGEVDDVGFDGQWKWNDESYDVCFVG